MDNKTRAAIGKQFATSRGAKRGGLAAAAHAAGYSLRALGEKLGVSHSYLSQLASGTRPVSDEMAAKIERLTGWKKWPRKK